MSHSSHESSVKVVLSAPSPGDGLRLTANLLDEHMGPEKEENVAIDSRVEVVFLEGEDGFFIPQFKLSGEAPQGQV